MFQCNVCAQVLSLLLNWLWGWSSSMKYTKNLVNRLLKHRDFTPESQQERIVVKSRTGSRALRGRDEESVNPKLGLPWKHGDTIVWLTAAGNVKRTLYHESGDSILISDHSTASCCLSREFS